MALTIPPQLVVVTCPRMWRSACSPGDPTPQRQCAWLLSTYLKEGEEQKKVLEAKDDEEKERGWREHETWR